MDKLAKIGKIRLDPAQNPGRKMRSCSLRFCPYCDGTYTDYSDHMREGHPISCDEVTKSFPDFSDGKLDEVTDEKVICHISDCKSCKDVFSQFVTEQIKAVIQQRLERL